MKIYINKIEVIIINNVRMNCLRSVVINLNKSSEKDKTEYNLPNKKSN